MAYKERKSVAAVSKHFSWLSGGLLNGSSVLGFRFDVKIIIKTDSEGRRIK